MKKIIVFVTVFALALGLVACAAQKAEWQSHLDLGQKYLLDGNYEQAIVEFNRVIEIDPKNVEAYIGLADAYAALGDYESAIEALERGIAETDSDELRAKLEEIRALAEAAASAGDEGQGETETGTGGDEDRGEPETTGQEEQTEQEEETPEVPEFIWEPPAKSYGTAPAISIYTGTTDDNRKMYTEFGPEGEWAYTNIQAYNSDTQTSSSTTYRPVYDQTTYNGAQSDFTINVIKSEYSYNRKEHAKVEYDSERQVWIVTSDIMSYESDSSTGMTNIVEFSASGNIMGQKIYSDSGELVQENENEYDENGNQVKQTFFYGLGEIPISGVSQYSYDSQGRIIEVISDYSYESYESNEFYQNSDAYFEYDSSGKMVRTEAYFTYNNMMQKSIHVYEYNSDNLPVKQTFYASFDAGNGFSQSNLVRTTNYVY